VTSWEITAAVLLAVLYWLQGVALAAPYLSKLLEKQLPTVRQAISLTSGVIALLVVLFFVQVGGFALDGLKGVADPFFVGLIWSGPAGTFVIMQALFAVFWFMYAMSRVFWLRTLLWSVAIACMLYGYTAFGHSGTAASWQKLVIALHIAMAFLWFGSLPALRKACTSMPLNELKRSMEKFGRHMLIAVPLLFISGLLFFRGLSGHWLPQLPLGDYELVLLVKLISVAAILTLAAVHKLWMVPHLEDEKGRSRLQRSIAVEMVLASLIFLVAAALSTSFSP